MTVPAADAPGPPPGGVPRASRGMALRWAGRHLPGRDARLDAERLLAHVLGLTRTALLAESRAPLGRGAAARYAELVARRAAGEPVAYLVGRAPFVELELEVTPEVLIPRPETERLAEWARERIVRDGRSTVLDVGTGSGALALAAAGAAPPSPPGAAPRAADVHATDISPGALAVARRNAARLGLRVSWYEADLLPPAPPSPPAFDLVLANLPYVALGDPDVAPEVVAHEPREAVFAGRDGLEVIARLLDVLPARLAPGAAVGLEVGWRQGDAVRALARAAFPGADVRLEDDLAGIPRLVLVTGAGGRPAARGP